MFHEAVLVCAAKLELLSVCIEYLLGIIVAAVNIGTKRRGVAVCRDGQGFIFLQILECGCIECDNLIAACIGAGDFNRRVGTCNKRANVVGQSSCAVIRELIALVVVFEDVVS